MIDRGLVVHLQGNQFFGRKTMESHLFYFSWCNDYTDDFTDCSIWQRKVQFIEEESWRALEINFAYISLSLVTELSLTPREPDQPNAMPNAAYTQLLTKFKEDNLSHSCWYQRKYLPNINAAGLYDKYSSNFLISPDAGTGTPGLIQLLIMSSIDRGQGGRHGG